MPENHLYTDPFKLPGPEPTDLAPPADSAHSLGGPAGPGGPGASKGTPEWLLLVLWRQKWLVLAALILSAAGAAVYMRTATPLFAGKARLYVQPAGPILGPGQPGVAQPNAGGNYLQTQKELLTSEPVLAIALAKLKQLQEDKKLAAAPGSEAALKDALATDLDRNNDIISVIAYAPAAKDAEATANAVVEAYMAYQTKPKTTNTNETLELLEQRKKDAEAKLQAAVDAVQDMERQYGALDQKDERTNVVLRKLQGATDALVDARKRTVQAKTEYEQAKEAMGIKGEDPKAGPGELDSEMLLTSGPDKDLLRSAILNTRAQLQELQNRFLPNHPYIIEMKRRLEGFNRQYLSALRSQFLVAQQQEAAFQAQVEEEQKRLGEVSAHAKEYLRKQEDVDRLKKDRDDAAAGIRNLQLARESGGLTIDVVDWGRVELDKSTGQPKPAIPNSFRVYSIGLAIGLLAALFLACVREWIDDRLHSAGEVKTSLGMPVLAVIPQGTAKRSPSVSGQRILLDPASDAAEAYRSLRTAVQFAAPEGQVKTLLVTSPATGDGKTTLASNLAIALAQAGKKVCLVDCDLRKPMQHEIHGVKNNTGLSMLLAGRCSLETATQRAGVTGLEILPCGPLPANPTEILNSREFGETLEQLADKYDYVVIDSPPVESVNDARIIAAMTDATLVVLKAQTSHRRQAERARNSLLGVGARIIGTVVNDLPRRTQTAYGQMAASRRVVAGLTSQEYEILQARAK